ncbi:hypothetical protein RFI_30695, partial [Reticulomyxa filosa]
MVKLQRLEEMARNQWIDKTMDLDSPEALLLNRVLERIYLDSTTTVDLNVNMLENNRVIEKISKLKALLTKHTYWIAANETNELFKRLDECVSLLSQFANEDKKLEYSLHIWFLKQLYQLKGMDWTQALITHKHVRSKFPIFEKDELSEFSRNLIFAIHFFAPLIHSLDQFRTQIISSLKKGDIDTEYSGKQDFTPLLAAASSIAIRLGDASLSKLESYILGCNILNTDVEQNFWKMDFPSPHAIEFTKKKKFIFLFKKTDNPFKMLMLSPE